MARVYEFVIGNDGDRSVGIDGWHEDVVIVFSGDIDGAVDREDERDFFRDMLAELADGWCFTREEWAAARVADGRASDIEFRDWLLDKAIEAIKAARSKFVDGGIESKIAKSLDEVLQYAEQTIGGDSEEDTDD